MILEPMSLKLRIYEIYGKCLSLNWLIPLLLTKLIKLSMIISAR